MCATRSDNTTERTRRTLPATVIFLLLWLLIAPPSHAAQPVEIVISGIEGDALKNVRETLLLPPEVLHEEKVDLPWLERFAKQAEEKTKTALEPFGYYHPRVTVTTEPVGKRYRVLVAVAPGEPVRLSAVTVTLTGAGLQERSLRRLVDRFPLSTGDVLLHQSYETAKTKLKSRARDLGYLDAEFSRHEIHVAESDTATLDLVLDTGEKYYFGATRIDGATQYPDSFLRRHLSYAEGEVFSAGALGETQLNFANSERFKEIVIAPDKDDAQEFRVPVSVHLTPGPRITVRPGIGYGTDTGGRFTVRYRDLNIFHLGHEFYANLYVAERLQGLVTGYTFPSPRDVRSSSTLQLNLQRQETDVYTSKIVALEADRNRSFGKGKLGTAYVKVQYEDYTVGLERSTARLLLPGVRFADDRYDNPIRPRRGFAYALDLHGTHQLLGSDTKLLQAVAQGSYLLPLPWRLSLHTRSKVGVTVLSDPLTQLPPSLRFFTGGDQSVRGYSYLSLGPRDASGKVIGGKQLLVGSVELERAIFKSWGLSLFYDAGNSFNTLSDLTLRQGVGVGVHYYTSVGGLNLSVARPLGSDHPALHLHFTVGFQL